MDNLQEYIIMCKEAHDLWKERIPLKKMDRVYYYGRGRKVFGYIDSIVKIEKEKVVPHLDVCIKYLDNENETHIYDVDYLFCCVYTQDQLQEIIYKNGTGCPFERLQEFYNFCYDRDDFYEDKKIKKVLQFTSVEQLWLAFVMKEKYNKVWNGEKWV